MSADSSIKLCLDDIDTVAVRIAGLYRDWNDQRTVALNLGQEVRSMVFATDINTTSSSNIDTKNRTHIPKLTELSDTLQSNYWDAIFGESKFFVFSGTTENDRIRAKKIEAWIRSKLETKKFRQKEGRALTADFVVYGNCFFEVDYIVELDDFNNEVYKGVIIRRVSPLDIVFDAKAPSFKDSAKIQTKRIHLADLAELSVKFPSLKFDKTLIAKIIKSRQTGYVEDWVETLHAENLSMDGYGDYEEYFKKDFVTVRVYRGDVYNPKTGKVQKHRIVWTIDDLHVILNMINPSPTGYDGLHHVGWRQRPDNLWGMGALDNLAGMQYRVNKVENLKSDILDLCAFPITVHKGGQTLDDLGGIYRPGNLIELDIDEEITFESPNPIILQYGDAHIAQYFKLMEDFAGAPPESRGIRSPGEKTKAEVQMLDSKGAKIFRDKSKVFETALEEALLEAFELTLLNFDGEDYVDIFDDIQGKDMLQALALEDIKAHGTFIAMGSKHWDRKNKRKAELDSLIATVFSQPKYAPHVSGWEVMQTINSDYELEETGIVAQFKGIKEDVANQAVAQAESQQIAQETGEQAQPVTPQQQPSPIQGQ